MSKSVEIHVIHHLVIISLFLMWTACQPQAPIEGPPSIPISLSLNEEVISVQGLLKDTTDDPEGAEAIRRVLMKKALASLSKKLGGHQSPSNIDEWREKLPTEDKKDAELYAWASQVVHLKSLDPLSLKSRFKLMFPQGYRLIGKLIRLTPEQAWTEDHYQRHLGNLRSTARLKLTQLRHQVIEGKDFGDLAKIKSHHAKSREQNGLISLDRLRAEGFSARIMRVVSELRTGEISPVLQDERGMYLFINEGIERPLALNAEGVFFPNKILNSTLLEDPKFWTLLETLCDQSNNCDLSQLLPAGTIGDTWRKAWRQSSAEGKLNQKARARRNKRKRRLSKKAKGDTRTLTGRSLSWSSLNTQAFDSVHAQYQPHLSESVIQELHIKDRAFLFERAPLFRALPIIFAKNGAWMIRLRGRTMIPALSTPQLKLISLDLTRKGLQTYWGTWGVDRIGQLLSNAAQSDRLDEALSTLAIQSTPINTKTLDKQLINELLSTSLEDGSKIVTYGLQTNKIDLKTNKVDLKTNKNPRWILIELTRKETVKFAEVKEELIQDFNNEEMDVDSLRLALDNLWRSLHISFYVNGQELNVNASDSRGFSRQIKSDLNQ
jgi:hypothetical protein